MRVESGCKAPAAALLGAGMLTLMTAGAMAQEVSSPGRDELETIIVTAQRREQSIQEVPIAVTAFGDETLDAMQVGNAADLQLVVPNFSYTATNTGGANYTIRGIGASVLGDGADTGVALHYNGAFLQGGGNTSLYYDVEAVEILRGPQGTLFGRNATGGVVNLRTHRPTERFEGALELTAGGREERAVEGMLNVPVGDDASMRLAFVAGHTDGNVRNVTTGNWINGNDVYSGRFSFRWRPLTQTTIDLSATYLRAAGDEMQAEKQLCHRDPIGNLGCLPDRLAPELPNYLATLAGLLGTSIDLTAADEDPFAGSLNPADPRQVALDFDPHVYTDEWISTLEVEQGLGAWTLSSITAFASEGGSYENDTDFAVASGQFQPIFPDGEVPASRPDPDNLGSLAGRTLGSFDRPWTFGRGEGRGRQWLQELRLASHFSGRWDFLIGGFYLDYEREEDLYQIATPLDAVALALEAAPPFFRLQTPVADLRSYALFGESYFKISEDLRLTGGLRWTRDEKQQVNRSLLFDLPQPLSSNELEKQALTGRVVLEWRPDPSFTSETLTYVSYSRGYKGGGFNPQGAVAVAPEFEPEYVNAFEVGAKNTLGAMSLNLAAFYYDYTGFQVSNVVNRTSVNENIDATIWGVEIEAAARLTEHWNIDLAAAHLSTQIDAASSIDPRDPTAGQPELIAVKDTASGANCVATLTQLMTLLDGAPFGDCTELGLPSGVPTSLTGNELASSPQWTLRFGAQYERQLGSSISARVRVDYAWRSDFWGRIFNRDPIDRIDGWGALNAQVEVGHPQGGWFVRLEGSNLLDEDAVTGMYVTDATSGLATNLFLLPARRVALVLGTRF